MKEALDAERVYILTMSDGPASHLAYHFIPRYAGEPMGFARLRLERFPIGDGQRTAQAIRRALIPRSSARLHAEEPAAEAPAPDGQDPRG
jgi:hypothetical protein